LRIDSFFLLTSVNILESILIGSGIAVFILSSIKYIDQIYSYTLENDLFNLLKMIRPDIRFLGDDYKNKNITGEELNISLHYIDRSHNWSTTKFKELIYNQIKNGKNI
jgi:bifunctional ADP-heptose synthase (sugar kinase/adenylyltransferase)